MLVALAGCGAGSALYTKLTSPLSLKLTCRPDLAGERSVGDSAGCECAGGAG